MRIHLFATMLWFAGLSICQAATQATFYVSPTGTGDYTAASPGSLSGVQAKVRTVNSNMTGDIIVYLKGGTYTLTSPLTFGPGDGGSGTNIVAYRNAPGEKPIISGGRQVTGWSVHSGSIWKATLTGVNKKIRNMFVNGARADMAKGPRALGQGGWGTYPGALGSSYGVRYDGIQFKPSDAGICANPGLIELHSLNFGGSCENSYCVRDMVSTGGFTVCRMAQPFFSMAQDQDWWPVVYVKADAGSWVPDQWPAWFNFYNAYEYLDQPGEFYYQVPTNTLYYIPRAGQTLASADVEIALTEGGLVNITGASLTNRVNNMQFWGITFVYSDWLMQKVDTSYGYCSHDFTAINCKSFPGGMDSQGFNNGVGPSGQGTITTPQATFNVESAKNIDIEWCVFKHTGQLGISLKNDATNCKIIGNLMYDLGGGGVNVGHYQHVLIGDSTGAYPQEYGPTREGLCNNNIVSNNLIHDIAYHFRGQPGIDGVIVQNMSILHNEVYSCPYSGLVLGWFNGQYKGKTGWSDCSNNTLSYNKIHDVMKALQDGATFYLSCDGYFTGTQLVENWIYGSGAGYYMDGNCGFGICGFTLTHNVQTPESADNADACDACNCWKNNMTQDQSVKDSSGLQSCYKSIANEPIAPLPGDAFCAVTSISGPAGIARAAVRPVMTRALVFDLRGRLLANFDHPSIHASILPGRARPMSTGIVVVKTEFAAGSAGRPVLAVVK